MTIPTNILTTRHWNLSQAGCHFGDYDTTVIEVGRIGYAFVASVFHTYITWPDASTTRF